MTKKEKRIEEIASDIAATEWKGKYGTAEGFKDVIIDAMNAGYNIAKHKFKKIKVKSKKKEFTPSKLPSFPYGLLKGGKTSSLEEIKE